MVFVFYLPLLGKGFGVYILAVDYSDYFYMAE